jgi:hypothetical protein
VDPVSVTFQDLCGPHRRDEPIGQRLAQPIAIGPLPRSHRVDLPKRRHASPTLIGSQNRHLSREVAGLCVPKTSSALITRPNRLNVSGDDRALLSVSPFKSKNRLAAENAALRHQLIMLQRKVRSRGHLTNGDRLFLVQLYRWFLSVLKIITIIRPETLARGHRGGFRRYWRWKSQQRSAKDSK